MESYILNTESQNIVGGINEVDNTVEIILPETFGNGIPNIGDSKIVEIDNIEPTLALAVSNKKLITFTTSFGERYLISSSGYPSAKWSMLVIYYISNIVSYELTSIKFYLLVLDKENPSQLTIAYIKDI